MKYGQLGVAVIAPICHLIAYAVTCAHPPYAVLPVIFVFSGFGNGLQDAGWNAWIGNMENPNQLLGFLHGSYGLGATISPLLATALVTKANQPWYAFYYIMVSILIHKLFVQLTPSAAPQCTKMAVWFTYFQSILANTNLQ